MTPRQKSIPKSEHSQSPPARLLSNTEIADRLASLAQLLSVQKENPYKVRAYQRAAARIRQLPESLDEMVRNEGDLTQFAGVGEAIASAVREIVSTGSLSKLESLRADADPLLAGITEHPRLDPKRVMRVYKKLRISTIEELKERLENGEIERVLGARAAFHVRQGLTEIHAMLLYNADGLRVKIEDFLLRRCGVRRAEVAGDYRRRVEIIEEIVFVVDTDDFAGAVAKMQHYGGSTPLLVSDNTSAVLGLSAGILLKLQLAAAGNWGYHLAACTGSKAHLRKLASR